MKSELSTFHDDSQKGRLKLDYTRKDLIGGLSCRIKYLRHSEFAEEVMLHASSRAWLDKFHPVIATCKYFQRTMLNASLCRRGDLGGLGDLGFFHGETLISVLSSLSIARQLLKLYP